MVKGPCHQTKYKSQYLHSHPDKLSCLQFVQQFVHSCVNFKTQHKSSMDFVIKFLNMSLPVEVENEANLDDIYGPENHVNTSISSHATEEEVCDTVILFMLIWIILTLWRKK